jgi:basic membrane protein A and related proteins
LEAAYKCWVPTLKGEAAAQIPHTSSEEARLPFEIQTMKRTLFITFIASLSALHGVAIAKDVKVAFLPCGSINDKSWSEAGYVGVVTAKTALDAAGDNMTFAYSENTPPAQVEAAARDYATRGYSIVILHCGTYGEAAVSAARAFPNVTFLHSTAPADKNPPANFFYYDIAQQEGSFIGGYLGGLMSKSGKIAAIGGYTFPAMVRQVEGFLLGARYANPKVKLYQTYINSFDDAGKAREAAQAQIDGGVDVIYGATDQAARGIFAAAQSAGVYAVADYADQASLAPKAILASVLYDFSALLKLMIVNAAEGKLDHGKSYVLGMRDGFGTIAPNPALDSTVGAENKRKVAAISDNIRAGRLVIPFGIVAGDAEKLDLNLLRGK